VNWCPRLRPGQEIGPDELRASIRARTHSALQMRAENNRSTGGKVYGYDTKGQVIDAEAAIVREIFARTADGESMCTMNGRNR
jgi:hypothetical protein